MNIKNWKVLTFAVISLLLIVTLSIPVRTKGSSTIKNSEPKSGTTGMFLFVYAARDVREKTSDIYTNEHREQLTETELKDYMLSDADIFFISGHGHEHFKGHSAIVTKDPDKGGSPDPRRPIQNNFDYHTASNLPSRTWLPDDVTLWGNEIPDLHNQHEFYNMEFAFISCCHSASEGQLPWITDLYEGFLQNGCEAYMGWKNTVLNGVARDYEEAFYEKALTSGYDVEYAKAFAEDEVPSAEGNIKLFGDGGVRINDQWS